MNYSTNYSMREPVPGEKVKVADINYNTEIIDGVMLDNRQISIDMYDDTSTYNTDDLAGHENAQNRIAVYRCLEDNVTGPWDSTKWVQTNLADEITDIRGNAGASDLGDLSDVEITAPTNGQALLYDDTTDKWHNSDLPDADVTKEASGNPIEFTDGADAPLVKCVTEIVGSQDLHGYDKPWVGGAGKNKFDDALIVNPTATAQWIQVTLKPNTNYTVSSNIPYHSTSAYIFAVSGTDTSSATSATDGVGLNTPRTVTADSNGIISFAYRNNGGSGVLDLTQYHYQIEEGSTATAYEPYSNICPITVYTENTISVGGKNIISNNSSLWEDGEISNSTGQNTSSSIYKRTIGYFPIDKLSTIVMSGYAYTNNTEFRLFFYTADDTYITYANAFDNTYTITNNTVVKFRARYKKAISIDALMIEYGNKHTPYQPYVKNDSTATYPSAIYRGSEDCVKGEVTSEWVTVDLGDLTWTKDGNNYRAPVTGIKRPSTAAIKGNGVCSHYPIAPQQTPTANNISFLGWMDGIIFWGDGTYETAADFTTAVTGVKLAYELATPTTTPVTPTNLPIKSLSGYNHIESSTGEMQIEYFPAKEQPLIDLIEDTVEQYANVYSTSERAIGEWIDGNTLYRRTYEIEVQSPSAPYTQDISIAGMVVVGIEKHYANYQYSGTWYYESGDQLYGNSSQYLSITQKDEAGTALAVSSNMGNGLDAIKICFSILYTKTSTRSLAKSAPQEETKEEQVEELKEEPEETKEEPVEEVKEEETKEEGEINER